MKTGMLIINYNDWKTTTSLIENIYSYSCLDEIVIVDNASTDESVIQLQKIENSKVTLIENQVNLGYGSAINVGSKYLINKYQKCNIFVSNADIIIDKEEDLKDLLTSLKEKNIGVVAPVIFERGHLNRGWKLTSIWVDILLLIPGICKIVRRKKVEYPESHYQTKESIVAVVSGCFLLLKSDALVQADFFDENMFLYYEENTLARKLEKVGYCEKINNEVVVLHNHSVTIDKAMKKINKYKTQRKSQYYYEIHYNHAHGLSKVLFLILMKMGEIGFQIYYKIGDKRKS